MAVPLHQGFAVKYIRNYYGVPAYRGCRVKYSGGRTPRFGTVTSSRGPYLRVRLDGEKHAGIYHPTWKLEYLETPLGGRKRK